MADYYVSESGNIISQTKNKKKKKYDYVVDLDGNLTKVEEEEIAPVQKEITPTTTTKKEEKENGLFKSGSFSDGFDLSDLVKAPLATVADFGVGAVKGLAKLGEGVTDLALYGASAVANTFDPIGAEWIKDKAKKNSVDDFFAPYDKSAVKQNSLLGGLGSSISEGVGQVAGIILTGGAGAAAGLGSAGVTALTGGTMFASSMGSGIGEAYQSGATDEEAVSYGAIKGAVDAGTELLFGGLGKTVNALGISRGISSLDDVFAKKLTSKVSNQAVKTLTQYGVKSSAEGVEEVLAGLGTAVAKQMTYMKDEELKQLVEDENLLEQFVVGAVTSGIVQGGSAVKSIKNNTDFVTGLTKEQEIDLENENKVIEEETWKRVEEKEADGTKVSSKERNEIRKQVEKDLEKGYISIDTIESVLGGDTYKNYQRAFEKEETLRNEYEELGKVTVPTLAEQSRYTELTQQMKDLKENSESAKLKDQLSQEVSLLTKNSRLSESYNEKVRKSQKFEADLTKYDEKQSKIIQKAVDSGILNNSNKTHDFVNMVAKISADKGISFDFTNNQKLKESGFAVDGATINGFVKDGNISLNIDSSKSLNSIVGHEVTHVLEGTELYKELQNVVREYATTKGEYGSRLLSVSKLYKGVENANYEAEVTADLVGDYLFTDTDFINKLSTEKPNIFKKIYNEIKYLYRVATAGSKEARQLEKVKRSFDKAYNESVKNSESDMKYSFAGEKALNQNNEYLKRAKEMDEDGKSNEIIRRETGWHKGYDGKWRFEIDDSQMKVYTAGDLTFRKAHPEYARLQELYDKFWESDLTESETTEFERLEEIYGSEYSRLHQRLMDGNAKLGDILEHDLLFANYPMLEKMNVRLEKFKDGTRGFFDPNRAEIVLDEDLFKSEYRTKQRDETLIHEIQHAIQSSEGFARGSSSEMFENQKIKLVNQIKGVQENLDLYLKDIGFKEYVKKSVNEVASGVKTFEQHGKDLEDFKSNSKYAKEILSNENQLKELREKQDTLFGSMYEGDTPFSMYQRTAGEIEARNTADRLNLTAEERKNTAPMSRVENVKRDNVVFSENYRFSLSETKEETKDLIALHNLRSDKLLKQLEMGGIAYPSIAITKPEVIEHDGFGEITLILNKDSVDPKASKYNKVYSGDAYTPTFPSIDYEANTKIADNISKVVNQYYKDIPSYYQRNLVHLRFDSSIDETLNREHGEEGLIDRFLNDYGMKEVYLAEKGEMIPLEISRTETEVSEHEKATAQFIIDKLGADVMESYGKKDGNTSALTAKRLWMEQHKDDFMDAYAEFMANDLGISKEDTRAMLDKQTPLWRNIEIQKVAEFLKTGGKTVKEEPDYKATEAKIDEKIANSDYEAWLKNLFSGIEGSSGIRNKKDMFTPSGARRSFKQLHDPVTVDNIVKAMRSDSDQIGKGAFGLGNIKGASVQEYKSIEEIKKNTDRLGSMSEEEHEQFQNYISDTIDEIANRYSNGKDFFDAKATLVEAVAKNQTKAGIAKYLKQYDNLYSYDESIVNDLIKLRDYIRSVPTPYFESKPQRAVSFDEIAAYVIPRNADAKLKQELLNRGYNIAEYDPNIEGDRKRVVNNFEEYKFSLSDTGKTYGNYNVYGKDIALQQDVAPLQEPIKEPIQEPILPEDYAPMTEEQANERDEQQSDRLYTLDEMDMPPEEAPYYEEQTTKPADPFYDRDIQEVGKRNVKAYMYENPEVKPYFQEEAQIMLGELQNSIKGEKTFNSHLYYETGGEEGWFGTKRQTSDEIAYLLDKFNYTYADLEKGLNAIIEDNGKENNAISKRIEFLLDERLREGYSYFLTGDEIPPNQDYINLLNEKQVTEYNDDAWNGWLESLTEEQLNELYGEQLQEDIAPVKETEIQEETQIQEDIAPTKEYEAIEPRPSKNEPKMIRLTDAEIAERAKGNVEEKIAEILDTEPTTEKQRNKRKWAIFKANVLDKGAVFEDLSLKKKNRELMGKWNYTLYSESKAQNLMGSGADGVKSLNDIRAEVENTGLSKQFQEYIYHKHNVDRMSLEERYKEVPNKPVFGYSVTKEASQEIVNQYEFAEPKFKEYAQDVYNYMSYLRKQLVDNGVIAQETADLWSEMYPHYVPIRRVGDTGYNINVPLDTNKTGVNAPIKRAVGGNTDILPLFDTMASRTMQTYKATAKNSFGVELKNTLGTTIESAETNIDEVIDSIDTQEGLLKEGKNGSKPTFTVFENGEKVTFEITEDMYDALKPVSSSSMLSKTFTPLNVASNIRKGLITEYNPVFMLTNAIKDSQDIMINSQHPAKTYLKVPEAQMQMLKKGYWYKEYMANGGEQNSYFDNETNTFKTENKGLKKLLDLPPLSTISKLNNAIEMTPRLAEYIASREQGRSIEVSMLDAARVSTNFRAGGDLTKFLNRNGATFLNASVQGAMQQVRNVREAKANGLKGWANLATKFAIAGVPSAILNHLLWEDDDDYEELSDYVKQNYYVVGKYGDGKFVRIPKGRTIAVIQEGIRQMSNLVTGNDEADLNTFLELMISNLAPNNPLENNIVAPIIQAWNNETWYGEDLVPSRLQDLPPSEQFDESTDSISKFLGEKLGLSPVKINYLLDQYSGGLGDVVLPMLTPEAENGDNSFVGNVISPLKDKFTTDSVMNNQNVSDFYDMSDTLTQNAKSYKATDEDVLMNKYFDTVRKELSELYNKKREIQSTGLNDEVKYNRVRELQKQIDALAKEALNTYQGVTIDGNHAKVGDLQYHMTDNGWTKITDKQLEKQNEVTKGLNISPSTYWSNKEEYDFKYESPEKYDFLKQNNISVADYYDFDEETKNAYTWAFKNPDKRKMSEVIAGDFVSYRKLSSELYDIKADKDENGKSISGSRKEKVMDYINDLDLEYGQKLILFKSEYNADDDYNEDIIEYLNNRNDVSYEEMETILKELGFTVYSDGTVEW